MIPDVLIDRKLKIEKEFKSLGPVRARLVVTPHLPDKLHIHVSDCAELWSGQKIIHFQEVSLLKPMLKLHKII